MIYAFDGKSPVVGEGAYVSEQALVIGDVVIGEHCYVGHGVVLRGDYGRIEIGPGTAVEEGVIVHAPPEKTCRIGEKVTLGHGAIIHASVVGAKAVIGMGAVLSLGARIGERAIVAEGAVVKMRQRIPDGVVVAGSPAKVIREVKPEDEAYWGIGKQLYIDLAGKYLRIGMQRLD